ALALVAGLIASGHVQHSRIAESLAGLDRYPGARTAQERLLRVRSILDGRRAVRTGRGPRSGNGQGLGFGGADGVAVGRDAVDVGDTLDAPHMGEHGLQV